MKRRALPQSLVVLTVCASIAIAGLGWACIASAQLERPVVPSGYVLDSLTTGFTFVGGIYYDENGRLLVAEVGTRSPVTMDGIIYQVDSDGSITAISTGLYDPVAIIVDGTAMYIADLGPTSITGDFDGIIWKDTGTGPAVLSQNDFTSPGSMVFDPGGSGDLLVSDVGGPPGDEGDTFIGSVDVSTGNTSMYFYDGPAGLENIGGLAIGPDNRVYASDNVTKNVHRILSETTQESVISSTPFVDNRRIGFDADSNLYICDTGVGNEKIYRVENGSSIAVPFVTDIDGGTTSLYVVADTIFFSQSGTTIWKTYPQLLTAIDHTGVAPGHFALHANLPNPFNATTMIRYDVPPGGGAVTLRIYNVGGQLVRTLIHGRKPQGRHSTTWDGKDSLGNSVASGVYFCRLAAPGFSQTRKMILFK